MFLKAIPNHQKFRVLIAEPARKLNDEGAVRYPRLSEHFCDVGADRLELARRAPNGGERTICDFVGNLLGLVQMHHMHRKPPEIFHERDPERNRDRPDLADRERGDGLERAHESYERLYIEKAVEMRDERQRDRIYARIAGELARPDLRQFSVIFFREILANLANLVLDHMEVVDEPFRSRRGSPPLAKRIREEPVSRGKTLAITRKSRQKRALGARGSRDLELGREKNCILLKTIGAEDLSPDHLLVQLSFGYLQRPRFR